mgnify:CR=1 FL=1
MNQCRLRFVIKCRMTKRTREFLAELMAEFSRSAPKREKAAVSTRTEKRLTVSVDLDPSTV